MKKPIRITTYAGGRYLQLYHRYTLPSLEADIARLRGAGYEVIIDLRDSGVERMGDPSPFILPNLRNSIELCLSEDAIFFLAPPDTVFAQGSLWNSVQAVENKRYAVAIPHIRATDGPPQLPCDAKTLFRWAIHYHHGTFANSFDVKAMNSTWAGISVRQISPDTCCMMHSLPTPYLVQFTQSDLDFWNNQIEWQQWDRSFLGKLWSEDRLLVVGSSDMAFCIEITEPGANVPELRADQYNDRWQNEQEHNKALKKMLFYMSM